MSNIYFSKGSSMKKLFYATVVLVGFLIIYLSIMPKKIEIPDLIAENDSNYISTSINDPELNSIIKKINAKADGIQTIFCESMPIRIKNGRFSFKVHGQLAHQKDRYFRLVVSHRISGKEMDIGSNKQIFWFWSKRMEPPCLYFSKHENIQKTNLKTPLNPDWMIESLNVGKINIENIHGSKRKEDLFYTYEKRRSASQENIKLVTVIDCKSGKIIGRSLTTEEDKPIVTTSYKDNTMILVWHEEDVVMEWDTSAAKLNVPIPEKYWLLPDFANKIDMGQ
jgi:hypothetical protein